MNLTNDECRGVYEILTQLSGHSPENVFAWDGSDDPGNPEISGIAKIFLGAGRPIPASLESLRHDQQ